MNTQKDIYLFLHERMDHKERAMNALISAGFTEDKVIMALPTKVGNVGDYVAMLYVPSYTEPSNILKIYKITKVDKIEPVKQKGIRGFWNGVSKDNGKDVSKDNWKGVSKDEINKITLTNSKDNTGTCFWCKNKFSGFDLSIRGLVYQDVIAN